MEEIHLMFKNGKYETIINKLTDISTTKNGLLEQLSSRNNITVCEYLQNHRDLSESETCYKNLASILFKLSSVSSKQAVVSLELTVLWNYLYIHVKHRHEQFTQHVSVYPNINRTFYRVCSILPGFERRKKSLSDLNPGSKTTCYTVVDICCKILQFDYDKFRGILEPFSDCCHLISVLAVQEKDSTLACNFLQNLKEIEQNFDPALHSAVDKVQYETTLSLKFTVDHKYLFIPQPSGVFLTSYLIGCLHCMTDQWEEGIKFMDHAGTNKDLKVAANILSGYGLYKLKRYTEAVSVFMETLRSCETTTQRLKARIYNWIGMCFENLGKQQLAIQMYREALSADFGFLRPLYNTSIQYRKLGINDVELECLNLLVTALEMKEKGDEIEDDGIDLLYILPIQDAEISYLEALYCFANRSLQLQRYTVAAEKYKHLITHLQSWDSQDYTKMPSLLQVHHEAILALLHANQLTDCLSLCNKVISCYHTKESALDLSLTFSGNCPDSSLINSSANQPTPEFSANTGSTRKRKRQLSESLTENASQMFAPSINMDPASQELLYEEDVLACKYKAEVLYKLGQHDSAIASAQRAVDSISAYKKKLFSVKAVTNLSNQTPSSSQPVSKKPRLNGDPQSTKHSQMNTLFDKLYSHSKSLTLEFELYSLMAKIMKEINEPGDALHFQRLASQIKPDER